MRARIYSLGAVLVAVSGFVLAMCSPAAAQTDWDACQGYDPTPSLAACTRIIEAGKEPPAALAIAHSNRGAANRQLNRYYASLADYNKAIELDPGNARAYFNRGIANWSIGRAEPAKADFLEALSLDPSYGKAHVALGIALLGEDKAKAIDHFTNAFRLLPDLTIERRSEMSGSNQPTFDVKVDELLEAAKELYEEKNDIARALAAYGVILKINPDEVASYEQRAQLLVDQNRFEEALADYNQAIRKAPKRGDLLALRCYAHARKKDLAAAMQDCDKAKELTGPKNKSNQPALVLELRGYALLLRGQHAAAVKELTESIELDSDAPAAHVYRATAYQRLRRTEDAQSDFKAAIELEPRHMRDKQAQNDARVALKLPRVPTAAAPKAAPSSPPRQEPPSQSGPQSSPSQPRQPPAQSAPVVPVAADPATGKTAGVKFVAHAGRASEGFDISKKNEPDVAACEASCRSDQQCKAYSYDGWNRLCLLKNDARCLRIDPRYTTAVLASLTVASSKARAIIDRRQRKAFPTAGYSKQQVASFDACSSRCLRDEKCEAFNFQSTDRMCILIARPTEYFDSQSSDLGIKLQPANADCSN